MAWRSFLSPNVDNLGLEAAGVEFTRRGVTVSDTLQTSNPDIYAVGDVCSMYQFTHVAGTMAGMVVNNALFSGACKVSDMTIPWVTYTGTGRFGYSVSYIHGYW
jgi:pyruvate/2-oxoglutarate dehydrogenase complex dihydrolipoamide dehydrogenase (E3) component